MDRHPNGSGTITQRAVGTNQGQIRVNGQRITVYGDTKTAVREKLDQVLLQPQIDGGRTEKQTLFELLNCFLQFDDSRARGWNS